MFRWLESRVLWGILLILGGVVFLLQNLRIIEVGDLFWALLFGLGGIFFLSVFLPNRENWWALIPGLTLLSIGVLIALGRLAPGIAEDLGGTIILGGIGLSFVIIYLLSRDNWWAVIPGGVLMTLAVVTALDSILGGFGMGGLFFLGMGLTFALVAILPTPEGRMGWAWIPAGILTVIGLLVLAAAEELIGYVWPVILILLGLFLISRTFIFRR